MHEKQKWFVKKLLRDSLCDLFQSAINDLNIFAEDSSIRPSSRTLRLFALKVSPEDVISAMISENPLNGALSVDP